MELVNTTPVPAAVRVADSVPGRPRRGLVVAKATFTLCELPEISADLAEPVHAADVEADDGLLPADLVPDQPACLDVILLGRAHAPGARPTASMQVRLSVGPFSRTLLVTGDRTWQSGRPSSPQPFLTMPLSWDRAFGGSAEAWIDADSVVPIADPVNPFGRGFDPGPQAESLCQLTRAPSGFPVIGGQRELPNLEDPHRPIAGTGDRPVPACWATTPPGLCLAALSQSVNPLQRCHPAWTLPASPPPGTVVTLQGATRDGSLRFGLPTPTVIADVCVGSELQSVQLVPQMLILRPEQSRFHIIYRAAFRVAAPSGASRCVRMRVESN